MTNIQSNKNILIHDTADVQTNSIGSGRYAAYANNLSTWGYDYQAGHSYTQPNTLLNIGQVII